MNLNDVDLLKLQTKFMQQDATTKAMCAALNPEIQKLSEEVKECLLLPRVDMTPDELVNELSEELLDELAWELHIEWYDANASIEVKRALIKNSDKVHQYLGTPFAVEQVIQDYFGDGTVEEWFEYGGKPYMFNVRTSNPAVTAGLANQFTMALDSVKNMRSKLEQIIISLSADMNMNFAGVIHTGDDITIEQVV